METLVVVAQHRDQYHSRSHSGHHGSFGSPSAGFREINCRTFQSGSGILPTRLKACYSPVTEQSSSNSPETPSTSLFVNEHIHSDQNPKHSKRITKSSSVPIPIKIHSDQNPKQTKRITKSSSVPIPIKIKHVDYTVKENVRGSLNDQFFYSELWAGPAYSNSPPPSSLPIPKFWIKPKRAVSLDLPSVSTSDIDLLTPIVKSAPPSPAWEHHKSSQRGFFNSNDSATKTLRRILNLDFDG